MICLCVDTCFAQYHEGQRFMMDSSSSIVSSKKMISDSSATGFPIGTGKPNHRYRWCSCVASSNFFLYDSSYE